MTRGVATVPNQPRATAARYDAASGRVMVELANGGGFRFPARAVQGLEAATDDALAEVEILGLGIGLHWERLDVDVSVPGLLDGRFGTKAWMDRQRAKAGAASVGMNLRIKNVTVDEHRLTVDLMDGRGIAVPLAWYPRLFDATPEQRRNWEIAGGGTGIHWPDVDEDLSAEGLLRGAPAPRALQPVRVAAPATEGSAS